MQSKYISKSILWLASYPKSGNTWLRAFLTALQAGGEFQLNNMKTDGIFASRQIFELCSDIESDYLYDDEAKSMIADVFRYYALHRDKLNILKIHDAFSVDREGNNIVPEEVTHCAIYIIRNPLDIAGSLANHNNTTIQMAVNVINNEKSCLACQHGNLNIIPQLRQDIGDWSSHVNGWTLNPKFPVHVVKYEDMIANTFETFNKILEFIGWEYTPTEIENALKETSFEILRQMEAEGGFREKPIKTQQFFRSGKTGKWKEELTPEQIESITKKHSEVMGRYQYLVN